MQLKKSILESYSRRFRRGEVVLPRLRPDRLFYAGLQILEEEDNPREAMRLFAKARDLDPSKPLYASFLGLTMALTRQDGNDGIRLCEMAVRTGYYDAEIYYNLGRVYLMSGQRLKARQAFLAGRRIDKVNPRIEQALGQMGERREPVFSVIPRSHRVNRIAGMLRWRMESLMSS